MQKRIEPAPKGGLPSVEEMFRRVEQAREYAPLDGDAPVKVPPWFRRTGPTTFTIDSGFGVFGFRTLSKREVDFLRAHARKTLPEGLTEEEQRDYVSNLSGCAAVVDSLTSLPEQGWRLDRPLLTHKAGDTFDALSAIQGHAGKILDKERLFETFPPSIAVQYGRAMDLMAIPPLFYEQATGTGDGDPS